MPDPKEALTHALESLAGSLEQAGGSPVAHVDTADLAIVLRLIEGLGKCQPEERPEPTRLQKLIEHFGRIQDEMHRNATRRLARLIRDMDQRLHDEIDDDKVCSRCGQREER